jgi:hypothetical protein
MKAGHRGIKTLKVTIMKKFLACFVLILVLVSCYDEYIVDYPYNAVYFPYQIDVRTFVVGEGMKIQVGVTIGGIRDNTKDRNVSFVLDQTMVTAAMLNKFKTASQTYIKDGVAPVTAFQLLPASYYTISDPGTMVIKKGEHMGYVVVKPDSAKFLADAATRFANYVLPFKITSADADSILSTRNYAVIGLRYEHMLFGKYWHGGVATINIQGRADSIYKYPAAVNQPENKTWNLLTNTPTTLYATSYMDQLTSKNEMLLTVNGTNVTINSVTGSTFEIIPEGSSTFNKPKLLQDRKLFLNYKFTNPATGWVYHCKDTLTFRNRLRDGINEWQDEDPTHYN